MPTDEVPLRMLELALELLREEHRSGLVPCGVWMVCFNCVVSRPAVAQRAAELGLCDLATAHLRTSDPADWVSLSCGDLFQPILMTMSQLLSHGPGEAVIHSGLFDLCLTGIATFAERGVEGLPDTHSCAVYVQSPGHRRFDLVPNGNTLSLGTNCIATVASY